MLSPAAAHAFVEDLDAPQLDPVDAHHFTRVLRLRPGEIVTVSDGGGRWRPCRFAAGGVLEPEGEIVVEKEALPRIAVGFCLMKGDRPEWTVQKLTEVGVDRIIPLVATRSVVRWASDRAARHLDRLRRVAREAAMQSRRVWLPEVGDVLDLTTRCAPGELAGFDPETALAHPGGRPPSLDQPTILVGPEGGWTPDEVAGTRALVGLGPTVLRAETAAVCAGFVLSALRAGVVGSGQFLR